MFYLLLIIFYILIQIVSVLLPLYLSLIINSGKVNQAEKKKNIRKQFLTQLVFLLLFLFIIFRTPSGLAFY
jgi:YidC/Oxa1 family membrane protein insertase